jgi:hypothetical protein
MDEFCNCCGATVPEDEFETNDGYCDTCLTDPTEDAS